MVGKLVTYVCKRFNIYGLSLYLSNNSAIMTSICFVIGSGSGSGSVVSSSIIIVINIMLLSSFYIINLHIVYLFQSSSI